jgi:hypothetical protein
MGLLGYLGEGDEGKFGIRDRSQFRRPVFGVCIPGHCTSTPSTPLLNMFRRMSYSVDNAPNGLSVDESGKSGEHWSLG